MLNSMWGKFGQATNKLQVKEFVDPQEFWTFLDSNQTDIRWVSSLNEARVEVHHRMQEHCETDSPYLNIFVACFTTCWAHLKLFEVMDQLGERCLYSDTDSVIFVQRPGDQYQPPLDDFLGTSPTNWRSPGISSRSSARGAQRITVSRRLRGTWCARYEAFPSMPRRRPN